MSIGSPVQLRGRPLAIVTTQGAGERIEGRCLKIELTGKQKKYKAGSARDLWWKAIQEWNGETVEAWSRAMTESPPSKPTTGQYAESGEPPSGWLSFFRREGLIEKSQLGWTDEELLGSLLAYEELQLQSDRGEKPSKKAVYDQLAGDFDRTAKAFEFRMQNISSVLNDMCIPWIQGLPPAKHVGSGVKSRLLRLIRENALFESFLAKSTGDFGLDDMKVAELMARGQGEPPAGNDNPGSSQELRNLYQRDLRVKAWVLVEANGQCECCAKNAPFRKADGSSYLEVHHVQQLAQGGSDTTSNTIAICPNCHRELHFGTNSAAIVERLYKQIARLTVE